MNSSVNDLTSIYDAHSSRQADGRQKPKKLINLSHTIMFHGIVITILLLRALWDWVDAVVVEVSVAFAAIFYVTVGRLRPKTILVS